MKLYFFGQVSYKAIIHVTFALIVSNKNYVINFLSFQKRIFAQINNFGDQTFLRTIFDQSEGHASPKFALIRLPLAKSAEAKPLITFQNITVI